MNNHNSEINKSLNLGDVVIFLLGLVICVEIKFYGIFNLTELILLVFSIFFFLTGFIKNRTANYKMLLILGILWLLSQIFTDIYRETSSFDALRGVANIAIFLSNFYALYAICFKRFKRLFFFSAGVLISQIIDYFYAPNLYVDTQPWKFGFGNWVNIFFVFIFGTIGYQFRSNIRFLLIIIFILFLVSINFYVGARSFGLILFISLLVFLISEMNTAKKFKKIKTLKFRHYFSLLTTSIIAIFTIFSLYSFSVTSGYLGQDALEKYEKQSSGSLGILFGSRQEILVSSLAIYDSPIIGHGSWAKDEQYADLLSILLGDFDYEITAIAYDGDNYGLIPTHSFLLGAWVYSGLLGAIFWLYAFSIGIKSIIASFRYQSQYKLFIVYFSFLLLWDILFSPLGLYSRTYAALMLVVALSGKHVSKVNNKGIIHKN